VIPGRCRLTLAAAHRTKGGAPSGPSRCVRPRGRLRADESRDGEVTGHTSRKSTVTPREYEESRFDPQQVVDEAPTWRNPISSVTDDTTAAKLVGHFAAGSREPGDEGDAFFDPAGKDLLAGMLLAASIDRRPITDVFGWLTDPDNRDIVGVLR
jgi:hypothetical protein